MALGGNQLHICKRHIVELLGNYVSNVCSMHGEAMTKQDFFSRHIKKMLTAQKINIENSKTTRNLVLCMTPTHIG